VIGPTQVNRRRRRHCQRAKDADRLQPKARSRMLQRLFGAHGHKGCRCRGGDYVTRVIQMEQGKPDAPPFWRQVLLRGTLLRQRVRDTGESECRSVMERIPTQRASFYVEASSHYQFVKNRPEYEAESGNVRARACFQL